MQTGNKVGFYYGLIEGVLRKLNENLVQYKKNDTNISGFRLIILVIYMTILTIREFAAKHITHLHLDIAFAEGGTGDFGGQVGDGWDGL